VSPWLPRQFVHRLGRHSRNMWRLARVWKVPGCCRQL